MKGIFGIRKKIKKKKKKKKKQKESKLEMVNIKKAKYPLYYFIKTIFLTWIDIKI